jgi:hypothetical protein
MQADTKDQHEQISTEHKISMIEVHYIFAEITFIHITPCRNTEQELLNN